MLTDPILTHTSEATTATIHLVIPRNRIQEVMGPAVGEVIAVLSAQGRVPTGPMFSRHFTLDAHTFDFEVGFPISAPITASGRVRPGTLPAQRVARAVYQGPYENLAAAWGQFGQWLKANGHVGATGLWESYIFGPESTPDPAAYKTELNRPLAN